jgi:uncharacterized damage-inducible protein DinB
MTTSLLADAFAHHVWASERLIDECAALTPEQLTTPIPGTYGSIIETLRHLVGSDGWYLSFFRDGIVHAGEEKEASLDELRSAITRNGTAWMDLLADEEDPDKDVLEADGEWVLHSPVGIRLAQVIHHGTDHRSHVCTGLTILGLTPPEIDVWAYARATGRERAMKAQDRGGR